jgi:hypothetical protein
LFPPSPQLQVPPELELELEEAVDPVDAELALAVALLVDPPPVEVLVAPSVVVPVEVLTPELEAPVVDDANVVD